LKSTITKKNSLFFWFIFLFFQIILYKILCNSYYFIEKLYIPCFKYFSKIYSQLFSYFSFSFGDRLYFVSIILFLFFLISIIKGIKNKNFKIVELKLISILKIVNIIVFFYHFSWGFLYYSVSLNEIFPAKNCTQKELKLLAIYYLNESIKTRKYCSEDTKSIYKFKYSDDSLSTKLHTISIPKILPLNESHAKKNIKKSLFSPVLNYVGVAGYFNPFTFEAQYNSEIPDTGKAITLAHEMAHQLGYAQENEANFVGFLICKNSSDANIKYSANYMALKYLLTEIYPSDSAFVKNIITKYSFQMKQDRLFEKKYFKKYQGKIEESFSFLNDGFLKMNNQIGVKSYNMFVQLLVGYSRKYEKNNIK